MSLVTPDERDFYEEHGFLVIEPDIPVSVLDAVVVDLHDQYPFDISSFRPVRVQDAWKRSHAVYEVATAPKVLSILKELYEREPLPFQTLNYPYGTEQEVHSDTIHFNSIPAGYMCGVWIALEDIDGDNGPLMYYPGSHKLPEYTMADVGVPAKDEYYADYERFIRSVIQNQGLTPVYATLKKGWALLWASNLLHGGSVHRDKTRTRHSQVTHFFFEGCRYYTPIRTDFAMRTPQWIDEGGRKESWF